MRLNGGMSEDLEARRARYDRRNRAAVCIVFGLIALVIGWPMRSFTGPSVIAAWVLLLGGLSGFLYGLYLIGPKRP